MSGIKRAILAEIMRDGKGSIEEVQKAFSPEAMRSETGRSKYNNDIVKNEDAGAYLGRKGKDATPGK